MQDERDSRNQRWLRVHTTGLACLDYGGAGPPALLLHGLAGTALEWADTASWMAGTHHVLALDQRGHGRSERRPADVSPEAFLGDVVSVIDELDLGAVVLVGQSLGGHTAMLVAARHPEWVRALVVVEASPDATTPEEVETVRDWLASWPLPFTTRAEAASFFGGDSVWATAWTAGFEERDGGWWPSFDADVVLAALATTVGRSYWDEWERITAPTLVVRAAGGTLGAAEAEKMLSRLPSARLVELVGGHDVHLESPAEWRRAVELFLESLPVA